MLEEERRLDFERYPDRYPHIWEGTMPARLRGAYYAQGPAEAREQGGIGVVVVDPLLPFGHIGTWAALARPLTLMPYGSFSLPADRSGCSTTSKAKARFSLLHE